MLIKVWISFFSVGDGDINESPYRLIRYISLLDITFYRLKMIFGWIAVVRQ